MAAGRYNFKIEQGSTVDFTLNYTDNAGTAIDLTDYEARMDIRPAAGSTILHATLSSSLQSDLTGIDVNPFPFTGSAGVLGDLTLDSPGNDYVEDTYVNDYLFGGANSLGSLMIE